VLSKSLLCVSHPQQAILAVPDYCSSLIPSCVSYWSKPGGYSHVFKHKLSLKVCFIFTNNLQQRSVDLPISVGFIFKLSLVLPQPGSRWVHERGRASVLV